MKNLGEMIALVVGCLLLKSFNIWDWFIALIAIVGVIKIVGLGDSSEN